MISASEVWYTCFEILPVACADLFLAPAVIAALEEQSRKERLACFSPANLEINATAVVSRFHGAVIMFLLSQMPEETSRLRHNSNDVHGEDIIARWKESLHAIFTGAFYIRWKIREVNPPLKFLWPKPRAIYDQAWMSAVENTDSIPTKVILPYFPSVFHENYLRKENLVFHAAVLCG